MQATRRVQYSSFTGPLFPEPRVAPALSWAPQIPERVWPKRGLSAACISSSTYTSGIIDTIITPPIFYIAPIAPDFIIRNKVRADKQQPLFYTSALPNYAVTMWPSVYPDKIWPKPRAPWFQAEFSPEPSLPNFPVPHLSWKGEYPDFARTRKPDTHEQFRLTNALPNYAIPDLSWEGQYPDFARGRKPNPVGAYPYTTWQTLFSLFPITDMKWLGNWPSLVPWKRYLPVASMPYFTSKPEGTPPPPAGTPNHVRLVWAGLPYQRSFLGS